MKGDADFVCVLHISLGMKMNLFHSSCVPCTSVGDGRATVTEPLALRALSSPQCLAVRYSDKYLVSSMWFKHQMSVETHVGLHTQSGITVWL